MSNPTSNQDSTELYYAEMEAARNEAEAAYFTARPLLNEGPPVETFRAGFERAFRKLWNERRAVETEGDARRTGEYWKAEHLAGNKEIERLRALLLPFGSLLLPNGDLYVNACRDVRNYFAGSVSETSAVIDFVEACDQAAEPTGVDWIRVSDRAPDHSEPVVYARPHRREPGRWSVGIAYWTRSQRWNPEQESTEAPDGFTHWKPLGRRPQVKSTAPLTTEPGRIDAEQFPEGS